MRRVLFLLAACIGVLAGTIGAQAQLTTTTLVGQVTDATGGAVPGAQVTAINRDTGLSRSVRTNDQGEYRVEFLPVGNYSVEVAADGFKKFVQTGLVLDINQGTRVDAALEVGAVTQTVSVEATAPLARPGAVRRRCGRL